MRDPFKAKTAALFAMLKAAGPVRVTLEEFRDWIDGHSRAGVVAWWCEYCAIPLPLASISVDHKIPLSQRGPNEPSNWAVCCQRCNEAKGPVSASTFYLILGALSGVSEQDRQSVLSRLRAGWRVARARNYKRRAA